MRCVSGGLWKCQVDEAALLSHLPQGLRAALASRACDLSNVSPICVGKEGGGGK
jgi:hypothetical protein